MQGIYVNGRRPKSKKEVKEALATGERIKLEATSLFGNEFDGLVDLFMPDGTYNFVGPDPSTNRKFYGTIKKSGGKITIS